MHSSGPDLTRAKHFGGSDPSYQVCTQLAHLFFRCGMVVMLVQVPHLPYTTHTPFVDPTTWDIVRIHLVPATPNVSPIANIGKKLIF